MIWVKLAAAIVFLVVVGMSIAFILALQDEAKAHYLTESASYAHLPTKGKGK